MTDKYILKYDALNLPVDFYNKDKIDNDTAHEIQVAITKLKTVEYSSWTLTKELKPLNRTWVLGTVMIDAYERCVEELMYSHNKFLNVEGDVIPSAEVIAWMPIPKPYEGEVDKCES